MNRPFVSVVLAYAAGLLAALYFQPPLTVLFAVAFGILGLALGLKNLRPILIWPLLALAGWTNYDARTGLLSPDDLRTEFGDAPAIVTLQGKLAESPRLKLVERDGNEIWHSVVRIHASAVTRSENQIPTVGEVLASVPGILGTNFFAGQPVSISGILARPDPPVAEGIFDYRQYLEAHGIYYQFKSDSPQDWQLLAPRLAIPSLTDRFLAWSRHTLALGMPEEDEPLRLLWAMTLGWRTAFTGDISDPFLQAGTMHMFAIDGLRIALLSGIIVTLLRALRLARAWCGAVAVPAIWFYTAATGWEPSAIRASVMMTVVLGGWALKRPGDLLNSLAAAAFIILVCDPRQLFEASFQFSFFVMLIIGLMLPRLNEFFDRLLRPDPLLPAELVPGWKLFLRRQSLKVLRFGGLSFAAWMGSIPLSAKYFHLFSPVSTLANIFAVPLGASALMANLGSFICGSWFSWATVLFNHAAWFFMVAMTWVSEQAARIPGAYEYVPAPSTATIAIYYAVLIAAFSGWFKTSRRIFYGGLILAGIAVGCLWQWRSARDETDLTVLPLHGGQVIYVDAAGQDNDWLINSGNELAAQSTLKDFLRAQGVNRIPRLVLTEGSARNCGGAKNLDETFGVGELCTSRARFRSGTYNEAVAAFEKPADRHKFFNYGDKAGCWTVLFPSTTNTLAKAEDSPLVLRGNFSGTKILILSDLSRDGQSVLLSQTNDLRSDIVVAGLPDTGEPLCDALIAAVQPKVIVIADSELPATRRANKALKLRLEQVKLPVIYTSESRAVTIITRKQGWSLMAMDGQKIEGK